MADTPPTSPKDTPARAAEAEGTTSSSNGTATANTSPLPSSTTGSLANTGKSDRKRTLKFHKSHERKFALEVVARDETTGAVTSAVCLFCKHFGREERPGRKRKATTNFKYFKRSFRTDQYLQHHTTQHPTNWAKYEAATEDEKRLFFPQTSVGGADGGVGGVSSSSLLLPPEKRMMLGGTPGDTAATAVTAQEKLCWFEVKKEIVDVVVGEHVWQPQHFRACQLVQVDQPPPIAGGGALPVDPPAQKYQIAIFNRLQLDVAVDLLATGLTAHQVTRVMSTFVKRTGIHAVKICAEDEIADYVRLSNAVSLNLIADLLAKSWAFSLGMYTTTIQQRSVLDIRARVYHNDKLYNFHLVAIPMIDRHSDLAMYQTFEKVMDAVFPAWRGYLIGLGTDGETKATDRVSELMTRIQQEATNPVYRTWCGCHQLDLSMKAFYNSLLGTTFMATFKTLIAYIRQQQTLVQEMGHPPSVVNQSQWFGMGQDTKWVTDKRVRLRKHLEEEKPACAPDDAWWVAFFVVNYVATRANETFKRLQNKHLVVAQQTLLISELASDFIAVFHAHGPFDSAHELRAFQAQAKEAQYLSRQGRFAMSKSNVREFIGDLGIFVSNVVARVDAAELEVVVENLAISIANLIEMLVDMTVDSQNSNNAAAVLPPVLPHELAQLNGREFAALLERHNDHLRAFFSDEEMDLIDQEHQALRRASTREKTLKTSLSECDDQSPFDRAWSFTEGRFKMLQSFAGGLATVFAGDSIDYGNVSIGNSERDSLRLSLTDFLLEGTLHGQQFHLINELHRNMVDVETVRESCVL